MNKKGFTLIELLAVIVILAIIALIATPIILNVIDTAKKGSSESSALGYIDAVEKQVMLNNINGKGEIIAGKYTKTDLDNKGVEIKGTITNAIIIINEKGQVTKATFCINGYSIDYDGKTAKVNENADYCNNMLEIYSTGEVVYLDPTDLTKICAEKDVTKVNLSREGITNSSEANSGCMKWYVIEDDDTSYSLILDHNIVDNVDWASNEDLENVGIIYDCDKSESSNKSLTSNGALTAKKELEEKTSTWDSIIKNTARLITAEEIVKLIGYDDFDSKTKSVLKPKNGENSSWLFDNTLYKEENVPGGAWYSYWTSTALDKIYVWKLSPNNLIYEKVNAEAACSITKVTSGYSYFNGIRPVITLTKN